MKRIIITVIITLVVITVFWLWIVVSPSGVPNRTNTYEPPVAEPDEITPDNDIEPEIKIPEPVEHEWITFDRPIIEEYRPLLEEYINAVVTDFADYPVDRMGNVSSVNPDGRVGFGFVQQSDSESGGIYYLTRDIDGNGIPELLIASTDADSYYGDRCAIHDIWTISDSEPVRVFDSYGGTIILSSGNVFSFYPWGGGEIGYYLKIAEDGKTAVLLGRFFSYHYTDEGLAFLPDNALTPWDEVKYDHNLWEEGLKPENKTSAAEWTRQCKEWGFPDNFRDNNELYLGDWEPLCDDGPPFLSIKIGKTEAINKNDLIVRKAPDANSEIIGTLYNYWSIAIIEESTDWYTIKYRNKIGYVSKEFIIVE